ncbi:MAG TPA: multicopper oxidase domain-containing protein [Candidatus Baltobacteraceae bacterium]|jgi:FtsP/CotA-like multicopper oxidase with cupredoxin domain
MRVLLLAIVLMLATPGIYGSSALTSRAQPVQTVRANDNRVAAGRLAGSELRVALDARQAIWHPDNDDGPGIPIQAFTEVGKSPQIPGPLIRVPVGTSIVASVRNSIPGTVLTVHGMVDRPTSSDRAMRVLFGKTRVFRFHAGSPGTYLYWATTDGKPLGKRFGADSQLGGAFIIDPLKATPKDRVFVIGQWINVHNKRGQPNFDYELDVINGRAWPHTERLVYPKNATVRWRWINAGIGTHPLHLHGFYFSVDSRGNGLADNTYANDSDRDRRVTEVVEPGGTFTMTWHADRPGNWLFHCHLAYHIIGHMPISAMLAGKNAIADAAYENDFVRHAGMGGLVLGVTVRAPASQEALVARPIVQRVQLKVERAPDDRPDAPSFRYAVEEGGKPAERGAVPSMIVLTRGVSSAIDVTNLLNEPTTVHWHGIELADSYYDGVTEFSGYGNHVAPMIEPGQTFEARMTPPRAGTFIYHTHMDDVWQLRGGLAGPLIVLEPGTAFDPNTDHVFTITTTHALSDVLKIFVNGTFSPSALTCHIGVAQRFRFINMTTFWTHATVSLSAADRAMRWRPLAVDGANVSPHRRVPEAAVDTVSIGETRDFTFTPTAPGELELRFLPDPRVPNVVTVPIHVVE